MDLIIPAAFDGIKPADFDGNSPLHAACKIGDGATFNRLVAQDPQKLFNLNYKKETVLDLALKHFSANSLKNVLDFLVSKNLLSEFFRKRDEDRDESKREFLYPSL